MKKGPISRVISGLCRDLLAGQVGPGAFQAQLRSLLSEQREAQHLFQDVGLSIGKWAANYTYRILPPQALDTVLAYGQPPNWLVVMRDGVPNPDAAKARDHTVRYLKGTLTQAALVVSLTGLLAQGANRDAVRWGVVRGVLDYVFDLACEVDPSICNRFDWWRSRMRY